MKHCINDLLVQTFLKTHSFRELQEQHGVEASFSKSGTKFSLNYSQLNSSDADPLAQQCRGLILAAENGSSFHDQAQVINGKLNHDNIVPGETRVVAYGFDRFFNEGQGAAAPVDWSDPKLSVEEKHDGTLILLYCDPFTHAWHTATRSVPEADVLLDGGKFTFRTLFEKALMDQAKEDFETFTSRLSPNFTYCFELTTPYNRIVVQHNVCSIVLLAVRTVFYNQHSHSSNIYFDHKEFNPATFQHLIPKIPLVKQYNLSNIQDVLNYVASRSPVEHEGIVVKDSCFRRIKVKNPSYVAMNRCRESLATSDRNCLELILLEKEDDVIPFLPQEIADNLLNIKSQFRSWVSNQETLYRETLDAANQILPQDRKTFALQVKQRPNAYSSAFFDIFTGKYSSLNHYIKSMGQTGYSTGFLDKILHEIKKS